MSEVSISLIILFVLFISIEISLLSLYFTKVSLVFMSKFVIHIITRDNINTRIIIHTNVSQDLFFIIWKLKKINIMWLY